MTTLVTTQQALQLLSMSNQQERRRSKRRPAASTSISAAAIPEGVAEAEPGLVATTPAGPPTSKSTSRTGQRKSARLKGNDDSPNGEAPRTEKRSTRNSSRAATSERDVDGGLESHANGAPGGSADQTKTKTKTSKPVRRWEPSPTPRRPTESSKIALPMSDTPVINRNKEMRKKGGKSNRRSSLGSRGRRASSLIDNGQTAIPHRDVDPKEFYKHIAGDLPEPRRMKQLLMWCGERALPQKPPHGTANSEAILGARAIQDQILKDYALRSDFSDWFNRDDDSPSSTAILQPNPRNIELDDKLAALEAKIQRLQQEKQAWQAIRNPPPPDMPPIYEDDSPTVQLPDFSLLEPEEGKIRSYLADELVPFETARSQMESRVRTVQSLLELEIDQLADNVHKLEQRVLVAGRQADVALGLAARRLKERERLERERAGTSEMPLMEVLRGLSGILPPGKEG
ncbi:hypothetical protein C2857_001241 [Epichloe festucae Fl1]|uniref:Kinetochore protein mis13 n=1 Tax=Epichloe festucae (strain Fl1) TaxID=877507 RepID=A0A7S9KU66_EPIFF|nr:hypothetical protein C2857_001241 [Epichloe festucae Fl1]